MSFEHPVGAAADAKELEYIAALIQTTDNDKEGFVDASIDARDIKYHLMSRYGIKISQEQVRKIILSGLGGGDDEGDCLDICEVVAALMIPFLRKILHDGLLHSRSTSGSSFEDQPIVANGAVAVADMEVDISEPSRRSLQEMDDHDSSASQHKSTETSTEPETSFKENPQFKVGKTHPEPSKDKVEPGEDEEAEERCFYEKVPPEEILRAVLKNILAQATGSSDPQPLTKELLTRIFAAYDETALVADEQLVSKMIAAARGVENFDEDAEDDAIMFDVEAFARALTSDVMLYDPSIETRCTTNFVDAFGSGDKNVGKHLYSILTKSGNFSEENHNDDDTVGTATRAIANVKEDAMNGLGEKVIARTDYGTITKKFTFSILDFTVDNQRSRIQVLSVWFGFIAFFIRFLSKGVRQSHLDVCVGDSFGCQIAQSIFDWTVLMLLLCILGVVFFAVVGSGNDVYRKSLLDVVVGLGGVVVFFVIPYVFNLDLKVFSTHTDLKDWYSIFMFVVFVTIGSLIVICQLINAMRLLFPDEVIGKSSILSRLLAGSNARDELAFKRAAVFKVNRMVENAYKLHQQDKSVPIRDQSHEGTHDLALLNFTKISDKTETAGGFLWAWKSFFNGKLKSREGIWLQTRIIAGMLAQLLMVTVIVIVAGLIFRDIVDLFSDEEESVDCKASFDPFNCYAPNHNGTNIGVLACTGVILKGSGCNSYPVDGQLLETSCQYIPPIPTTNETTCDNVYAFDDIHAVATGKNIQEDDCTAQLTTCVVYDELDSKTELGSCLLGMSPNYFLPYQFDGPKCENIYPISDIMRSMPKLIDDFAAIHKSVQEAGDELEDLKPERWMVQFSAIVGLITGIFVGLSIFVYYIPSTVSTVLKFRSGVLPSLRDPDFIKYRKSLEGVTYILGLMAWGAVYSAFVSVFLFAGIAFLLVWQVTRDFVVRIVAVCTGIAATLVFKTLLVTILGKVNYAAFYRKRPWIGNVAGVALECWHLGITTGYMLARTAKLIVAASMYIGRVDKPFMGDGVGIIGPVNLDLFPTIYRKGLLSADAHRHPYIERLGLLYLMKIRHGSKFATTEGSIWRLLFVFALMPWMRKYRIADDSDLPEGLLMQKLGVDMNAKYEELLREVRDENRLLTKEIDDLNEEILYLRAQAP